MTVKKFFLQNHTEHETNTEVSAVFYFEEISIIRLYCV